MSNNLANILVYGKAGKNQTKKPIARNRNINRVKVSAESDIENIKTDAPI